MLEVEFHGEGTAVRLKGARAGAGFIVATRHGDGGGVDWSYREGDKGFGFGILGPTIEGPPERSEILSQLQELASTGRVTC